MSPSVAVSCSISASGRDDGPGRSAAELSTTRPASIEERFSGGQGASRSWVVGKRKFECRCTQVAVSVERHNEKVDTSDSMEKALQRLPPAYSLALRLRDAGTPDEVICGYLAIEPESFDGLLRIAEDKLASALHGDGLTE